MSSRNTLESKRLRRIERRARKAKSRKAIPHAGVIVRRQLVRQHVYLQQHGLPHSGRVAALGFLIAA